MAGTEDSEQTTHPDPSGLPCIQAAPEFRKALFAGAGVALLLAAASLVTINFLECQILAPFSIYCLLLTVALFITGWILSLRAEVHQGSVDAVESGEVKITEELERFGRLGAPVLLTLGALAGLGFTSIPLGEVVQGGVPDQAGSSGAAIPDGTPFFLAAAAVVLIAFPFLVFSRATARIAADRFPEAAGLSEWLRGGQWTAVLTGSCLLLEGVGFKVVNLTGWVTVILLVLVALLSLEMLGRALGRFFGAKAGWRTVTAPVRLVTLTALFRGRNPVDGILEAAENRLGITLRAAWAFSLLRRSFLPLVVLMAFILWLSTALVVVGPAEEGVRLRFGRLVTRNPVAPGLAWKLPWPLETIDRVPTRKVQTLSLGYTGVERPTLLWTEAHRGVDFNMLLGDGRELVSVNAVVTYRIKDLIAYALNNQNPRDVLDAQAYRLLMRKTVVTSLDQLLSVDRDRFSNTFSRDLQAAVDEWDLGLEILHTTFVALHPPVKIAPEYQAVVGAQIAQETLVIRAEVDRARTLPAAQAEVQEETRAARGDAALLIAEAKGGAARFLAGVEAHEASPDLFEFRRWLEALEEGVADLKLFILDPAMHTAGPVEIWLDLRSDRKKF